MTEQRSGPRRSKDRSRLWLALGPWGLIALLALLGIAWFFTREPAPLSLRYGELKEMLKANDPGATFHNVRVGRTEICGEIVTSDPVSGGRQARVEDRQAFRTSRIGMEGDRAMPQLLKDRLGPAYQGEEEESVFKAVSSAVMTAVMFLGLPFLLVFLLLWMVRGKSPFTFGQSRHKLYAQKDLHVTFEDVAGIDETVTELREIVEFLRTPDKYQALGGRIPKGVLLVGPPGTGKTLLAKAVAGEADVPFFSLSGSDFVEMFVGVGASRVRDLFSQAESRAPCIIFIDELDALGKTRGGSTTGGHDEREQTLNQLLVEMDGFDSNRGVIIMAATNRPEILDIALLRPGRFDRTVVVDRPDILGREAILKVHVRNVRLAGDVDLRHVASLTPGSVGADLANLVNEAALMAARKNKEAVSMADLDEAVERGAVGLERKSRIMHADEKQRVAYHEAGHALVACALPNTHPVHKVSIIPRGVGALGYVLRRPEDDRYLTTQSELLSHIKVALAGTLAEELVYREISNGATNDLENVHAIASDMVKKFGMSRLGRVSYPDHPASPFLPGVLEGECRYSEETSREIDLEVRKIIESATEEVRTILKHRRAALEVVARRLMEKEVIDGGELRALLETHDPGPKLVPGTGAVEARKAPDEAEGMEISERRSDAAP